MIFYNDSLVDNDFLDSDNQIQKCRWKNYWRAQEQDPETRRDVRCEKAAMKKRIHQKNRRNSKDELKRLRTNYQSD